MASWLAYLTAWNMLGLAAATIVVLLLFDKVPLSYNFRNLTVRWITTTITALAFTVVVLLLTVMMSLVAGMDRLTENTGQPENVMVLADGATDESVSNLTVGDLSDIENLAAVARENGRPVASRETFLVANQPVPNRDGGQQRRRFLQLRCIDEPELTARVHKVELLPGGRWFSEAGVQESPGDRSGQSAFAPLIQAVLGEGVAYELGRDRTARELATAKNRKRLDVGDTFELRERTWIVVGVLKSGVSTFNSEIWTKRSLAVSLFGKDAYSTLVLHTTDAGTARQLKEFLAKDYKKAAVNPQVETDYYASLSETNAQLSYAIAFLAVVMSAGGIFGVMNTMFAAVSQRTADIGVLRLMGYARGQILISFLLESLVISLLGGLLGCGLGSLVNGLTVSSIVGGHAAGRFVVLQLTVDAKIVATGILLSLAMGFLGGLLPALSAMRLRPLEALK
jgi:putative ABC transport system permease protein